MIKSSAINFKNSELTTAFYSFLVAGLFCFLSFYDTDADIYLFPRIIAVTLLVFSVILLISSFQLSRSYLKNRKSNVKNGLFLKILPGLLIGFIYMTLMDVVGFYTSAFFIFLAFLLLYGKREMTDPKAFIKKVAISIGFVFVLYLLFWQGLHVRTPIGLLL
jgi:hypothetical protein